MEARRLFGILGRSAWLIVLIAVIAGVAVGVLAANMPKAYQASTKLVVAGALLGDPPQIDEMEAAARLAQTMAELASTRPVIVAALDTLGLKITPEALRDEMSARAAPGSLFITISVRGADARSTSALANAIASQLILQAPHLLGATSTATVPPVSVVEPALPPTDPSSPSAVLYGLLAAVAAAFMVMVVVILAASRKQRAQDSLAQDDTPAWPATGVSASQVRDTRT